MVAHVQTVAAAGDNTSSVTTAAISTTTGNGLAATFVCDTGLLQGLADSAGNTWTPIFSVSGEAADGSDLFQRYVSSCVSSAAHTFTVTLTSPGFPTVSVTEISGHISEGMLDVSSNSLSGTGTSHVTPNITTTEPNALILGVAGNFRSTTWAITDAGFTERSNIPTAATSGGLVTATRVVANTGTFNMTYSTSRNVGTDEEYREATTAFKGLASAPTELPCRPFRFSYRYT